MALLPPLLVLSVALLDSASISSASSWRVISVTLANEVADVCRRGTDQTFSAITGELKTRLRKVQRKVTALQEQQERVLGSACIRSAGSSRREVADSCMRGTEQTFSAITGKLKTELRKVQRKVTALQEQQQERLETVQEQLQQQMTDLQWQQTTAQKQLQRQISEQLRATSEQLQQLQQQQQQQQTALKEQLTAIQKQLSSDRRACENCPGNWTRHGDNCYRIPSGQRSWLMAHLTCSLLDPRARLVSIRQANSDTVNSLLQDSGERYVWIGLHAFSGRNDYSWVDFMPMNYTNWAAGEPNSESRDCVAADTSAHGEWTLLDCATDLAVMCQISLN